MQIEFVLVSSEFVFMIPVDTLIVAVAPKPPAKHLHDDDDEEEEEELVRVFCPHIISVRLVVFMM